MSLELVVKVPDECITEMIMKGLESVLSKCNIEFPNGDGKAIADDTKKDEVPKKVVIRELTDHEKELDRKLIKYICADCGSVNFKMLERLEDGMFTLPCRQCETLYAFKDEDLLKVEYECSRCGKKVFFYTPKGYSVTMDKCGTCENKTKLK